MKLLEKPPLESPRIAVEQEVPLGRLDRPSEVRSLPERPSLGEVVLGSVLGVASWGFSLLLVAAMLLAIPAVPILLAVFLGAVVLFYALLILAFGACVAGIAAVSLLSW